MWDNPRILNMAAGGLVGIAVLMLFLSGTWLLLRSPLFPVTQLDVKSALAKTTSEEIEAATRGRIGGNFFAVAPAEVRAGPERLPWARRAAVVRGVPVRREAEP